MLMMQYPVLGGDSDWLNQFRCSVQPLELDCKIIFNHTVLSSDCGELVP